MHLKRNYPKIHQENNNYFPELYLDNNVMNKKSLSERDICTKYITPAIKKAGWDTLTQLLEEVSFLHLKANIPSNQTWRIYH